jgi:lipopolysaccharide export system protein LptA
MSTTLIRPLPVALSPPLTSRFAPAAAPAEAQTVSNTFGGFSKNSDQPIDIESDVLVVHDAQKYATFKGNVKAVQGSTTLRATELDVHYVGGGSDSLTKGPDATGSTQAVEGASEGAGGIGGQKGTQISRSRQRATSSSPATRIRPQRAIGPFTMCPPSS